MSYSMTYGIQFIGENYSAAAFQEVQEELQKIQTYSMNVTLGVEQIGTISTQGFRNLVFGTQMGLFYMSMLAGGMNRTESAEIGLEMAQERLNETIKKYGPASSEAAKATQQLERSQLYYQRSLTYSQLMTASMGLQMVSMALNITMYALPSIHSLTASIHGLSAAFGTLWTMMGPLGWAILGVGAAAGIGAGLYFSTRGPTIEANFNTTIESDIDNVLEEYKRRLKRALNQGGVP